MINTELLEYYSDAEVCKNLEEYPALSLLVHLGLYANISNEDILHIYSIVFQSMENKKAKEWINDNINIPDEKKHKIVYEILNLFMLKSINSQNKLIELFNSCQTSDCLVNKLFYEIHKVIKCNDKNHIKDILSLHEISIRIGQYAHSSILMEKIITNYPINFYKGYSNSLSPIKSQKVINTLWNSLKNNKDYKNSSLIWRSKAISSSFNNLLRIRLFGGKTRHNISKTEALDSCNKLLSKSYYSEIECVVSYEKIIFDHLAATIILNDSTKAYEEIIATIPLPMGWKIKLAEYIPRQSYHQRLWTLIEIEDVSDKPFIFELMIKNKMDFDIGRAYSWREKNCLLALSTSPWSLNGSFNREMAIYKMKKYKSINSVLTSEVEAWYNNH